MNPTAEYTENLNNDFTLYLGRDYGGWVYWIRRNGHNIVNPTPCAPKKGQTPLEAAWESGQAELMRRYQELRSEAEAYMDATKSRPGAQPPEWARPA